ncbi:GvpL/GvpF family gas vesicle protein [Streptomyces uncialis]|uniref:GvpL/GvpF family gas vesicle protein n=1 Tax=Streptomyces uncialis TaxID=1048205 RepID=UPI003651605E
MTDPRYVYAVCRPWDTPLQAELGGVAGAPPKRLRHGPLVAVVSVVPARDFAPGPLRDRLADPAWRDALTRAHEAVVAALTTVTTPLPLRPATVFPDDSAVRVMLEDGGERLQEALTALDGHVEWGVTVTGGPPPGDAGESAEGLGRRLHTDLSAMAARSRSLAPGDSEVPRAAPATRGGEPSGTGLPSGGGEPLGGGEPSRRGEPVLLNAAYLVHRSLSEEFVEHVERFRERCPGAVVSLSGPWAPYSFTPAPYGSG